MANLTKVEYRVRKIERFTVTRFHESGDGCGVEQKGEYDSATMAYEVGYALAQHEHQQLGWPIADERITYPNHPGGVKAELPPTT